MLLPKALVGAREDVEDQVLRLLDSSAFVSTPRHLRSKVGGPHLLQSWDETHHHFIGQFGKISFIFSVKVTSKSKQLLSTRACSAMRVLTAANFLR